MTLESGTRIGPFVIQRLISDAGSALVYQATDENGRSVAVKVLSGSGDRALREARITTRLSHPNIVPTLDVLNHEGDLCLVQEWIPGPNLEELLQQRDTFDLADTIRLGIDISSALTAAHEAGVVHRDVKPSNVLFAPERGFLLTDFGAVGRIEESSGLTRSGQIAGTPLYMSPEQLTGGALTPASDLFGLGLLLHRALYGELPGEESGDYMRLVFIRGTQDTVVPPSPLRDLLRRCLARDPARRPSSATAVLAELRLLSAAFPHSGRVYRHRADRPTSYDGPNVPASPKARPQGASRPEPPLAPPRDVAPPDLRWSGPPATARPDATTVPTTGRVDQRPTDDAIRGGPYPRGRPRSIRRVLGWSTLVVSSALVVPAGVLLWTTRTGVLATAGRITVGLGVAASAVVIAWLVRGWLASREPEVRQRATGLLFGTDQRTELTRSMMVEVDQIVVRLKTLDAKFLGLTVVAMIHEYEAGRDTTERVAALQQVIALMERLTKDLSPWHIRHQNAITTLIAIMGSLAGVATAVSGFLK